MNINLNLATRPYIELRSVYSRLRVAALVLLVCAMPMLLVLHTVQAKARLAEARVNQLESNISLLRQQQRSARALALQGPNSNVISQAAFLNDLFRRKAFSWTATMSDLEGTLPYGVQVQAIDPVVAPDGRVTIRMRVTGARERTVEVVHNLERSRYFVAPRLAGEALADQSNGGGRTQPVSATGAPADVSFDILADYRPLPNTHAGSTAVSAAPEADQPAAAAPAPVTAAAPASTRPAQLTNPERRAAEPPDPHENPHAPMPYGRPLPAIPPPIGGTP